MISLLPELICSWSYISMFFNHLLAWPCGSTIIGHFIPVYIMIAFSIEKESTGRLDICHLLIRTCSPRTFSKLKSSDVLSE